MGGIKNCIPESEGVWERILICPMIFKVQTRVVKRISGGRFIQIFCVLKAFLYKKAFGCLRAAEGRGCVRVAYNARLIRDKKF